jgi:beta-fructofuranosidase
MKLTALQQTIIAYLEPFPTGHQNLTKVSLIERGKLQLSATLTGLLRHQRRGQPMIWDPWILKDGDTYRLFYLEGVEGQIPWWTISNIRGAISPDLENWEELGILLKPQPDNDWESGRVCAGCTYKENGVYYLFYSAGGKEPPHLRNEGIGLAISTDGVYFSRVSDRPLVMPSSDDKWYGRSNWTGHFHWRDPYLFKDEQTGKYYLFICASAKTTGQFQGSIGLAIADRITGPYQIQPPVIEIPEAAIDAWAYYHMERPQVVYRYGKYHLFFSCFKMFFNPKCLNTVQQNRITNSSLYWYTADRVIGPYQPCNDKDFVVQGSERTGMYGTNFLQIADDPEELIAYGWYHRLHTLEVSKRFRVHWDCDRIQLTQY